MLNENQRINFNNNIKDALEYITNSINGNECKLDPKLTRWIRNTSMRYKYTVEKYDAKFAIPEEHIRVLKNFFDDIGITAEEFMSTGSLRKIVDIILSLTVLKVKNLLKP